MGRQQRAWLVRQATPADDAQLQDLYRSVSGRDRALAQFKWQYRDNPDGEAVVAVADVAGRIVGQYALSPTMLRLGPDLVLGAQSFDTMTHPDYRGQGMFVALAQSAMQHAAERGVQTLYGFPNSNSYHGFVRRLDWDCTGTMPVWFRPLAIAKHPGVPGLAAPLASLGSRILPTGRTAGFELADVMPGESDVSLLIHEWQERSGGCRVARSVAQYRWRFSAASGRNYRWTCAYRRGRLVALAVWGIDPRTGNALLSETMGTDRRAVQAVIASALGQADRAICPLMLVVSSRGYLPVALWRCGFIRSSRLPLIVRKLTARELGADIHSNSAWSIFGADVDTF